MEAGDLLGTPEPDYFPAPGGGGYEFFSADEISSARGVTSKLLTLPNEVVFGGGDAASL